jgi:hypothetical protein
VRLLIHHVCFFDLSGFPGVGIKPFEC